MGFEILDRAAAGRLGRFTTAHGAVTTPALMPVVNPNIELVPASQMRSLGAEMLITNSYVLWKHENLREQALKEGAHKVLGWDGPLMTDSGTFQMWVYGDVEVPPDEIVKFQAAAGVDVATCLDLFVTPETGKADAERAVATTIERTKAAVAHKGKSMLNATVQGGVHLDLRSECAKAYRDVDVDYHTIGGVVPLMQDQRYVELAEVILWSQASLRKDRPVHLFGAGHPLVFPLAAALGCDLFDSSSYAKYAKDGRIITPEGTLQLADLTEWPLWSRFLSKWTPAELRQASSKERDAALATHNLEVCLSEVRRVRESIRDGSLWELVEQRAACHPMLAAATKKIGDPIYQEWLEKREPVSAARALRYTGHLTHRRPLFRRIRRRLMERVVPSGEWIAALGSGHAEDGAEVRELGLHKEPADKPWGDKLGSLDPAMDHAVISGFGPVPVGLDECYPFAQSVVPRLEDLDRGHMGWVGEVKDEFLAAHTFIPAIPGPGGRMGRVHPELTQLIRTADWQFGAGAGAALAGDAAKDASKVRMAECDAAVAAKKAGEGSGLLFQKSPTTGKVRTLYRDGEHILSLRAGDGFWTLKVAGAKILHDALPAPRNRVVVKADSVPFNKAGKSVFAQFVVSVDPDLRPMDECLVVDEKDHLVAIGQLLLAPDEVADFRKGMAVKVREGVA